MAFLGQELSDMRIPDSVEELCDRCFADCCNLENVTFGEASVFQRIGVEAFMGSPDRSAHS